MNYSEALQGAIGFPLSANTLELHLTNRGLVSDATYTTATKKAFDLATADALMSLVSFPNIAEMGYTLTLTEKNLLIKRASQIFELYGVPDLTKPKVTFVRRM
jgi:hypothetical protein